MVLTTEGDLLVVKRSPQQYEELRRYKVADGEAWAQPVLLLDQVVIRDAGFVTVWSLR